MIWKEPVHLKVARQLLSNNPFDDLGNESQVRNWTITLDIVWIKIMFLEDWCDDTQTQTRLFNDASAPYGL